MLAESTFDRTLDDDDWLAPPPPSKLHRTASVENSWGVTCIGRGFDWNSKVDDRPPSCHRSEPQTPPNESFYHEPVHSTSPVRRSPTVSPILIVPPCQSAAPSLEPLKIHSSPSAARLSDSPVFSSPQSTFPIPSCSPSSSVPFNPSRSPSHPRPRRRSSQQRVSLIAGRVSIAPMEPPSPSLPMPQILRRSGSSGNLLSSVASTKPPTPVSEAQLIPSKKTISDFFIEGDLGRGAYGLVKRAREYNSDGSLGVRIAWHFRSFHLTQS